MYFTSLINGRREKFEDYDFKDWLRYLGENKFNKTDIIEMMELAVQLPKFAGYFLTIGDVIHHWKKETGKNKEWDWAQFYRMFYYFCSKDKELVKKVYTELTGFEDMLTDGDRERMDKFVIDALCERNSEAFYQEQLKTEQAKNNVLRKLVEENEKLTEQQEDMIKKLAGELVQQVTYDLWKQLSFTKFKKKDELLEFIGKFQNELDVDKYFKLISLVKKYS